MLKRIVVVLTLLITGISVAQEGTTSPYSFYGIGTLKFRGTAENRSMAGMSTYSDSIHMNLQNPAGLAGLRLVNYGVGGTHQYSTQATDDEKQKTSTTSLDFIAVAIPMGKFGGAFGLLPFTSVGYNIEGVEGDVTTQYQGTGGLNKAFVALAYQVTPELSIGVDGSYNFGNIENIATTTQEDIQFGTREADRSDIRGFSFNFGAQYKTMVSENLELSTSITYTPETAFTSQNERGIATVLVLPDGSQNLIDVREIPVDDTDFTFPSQFTVGAGIGQPKKWFIGGEYTNQKTSNFTNRFIVINNQEFTDASKFRLGGFYIPNYNSFSSYWNRVVYRAGFRYEQTGIMLDGQDIDEFGISFGVGLPVGRLFSNINIGFELGRRGTKDFGLVQENFFNTFISLSLNDRWFEKRYYD